MKVIRNCYSTQGKGYFIHIQFRYTALLLIKSNKMKLLIDIFTHYKRFKMKLVNLK